MAEKFVVMKVYSDGSGHPIPIYIGDDKAAAFDALINSREYWDSDKIKVYKESEVNQPTPTK